MIQLYRPIQPLPSPFVYAPRTANTPFNLISQEFGKNDVPFYAQLGLKGHNGIDFIAPTGTEVYASHNGKITKTYDTTNSSPTIGYGVWITHSEGWQTVYFHLKDVLVKVGDTVKAGDLIGHADNTGQFTTGSHLHFGLYPDNPDKGNGYDGAIDPIKYFSIEQITGLIIKQTKMYKLIASLNPNYPEVFAVRADGKVKHVGDYITLEEGDGTEWDISEKQVVDDDTYLSFKRQKSGAIFISKST